MQNLGEKIRQLRLTKEWPQRELAYHLDIDVSVLSRIENENNFPKKRAGEILEKISNLFLIDVNELSDMYLSDQISSMLIYEDNYQFILKVCEEKIGYQRSMKVEQSKLDLK